MPSVGCRDCKAQARNAAFRRCFNCDVRPHAEADEGQGRWFDALSRQYGLHLLNALLKRRSNLIPSGATVTDAIKGKGLYAIFVERGAQFKEPVRTRSPTTMEQKCGSRRCRWGPSVAH